MSPSDDWTGGRRRPGNTGWFSKRNRCSRMPRPQRGGERARALASSPIPAGRAGASRARSRIVPARLPSPPSVRPARFLSPAASGRHRRAHLRAPHRGPQLQQDRQGPRHRGVDSLALRPQCRGRRPLTRDAQHSRCGRQGASPSIQVDAPNVDVAARLALSHHIDSRPTPPASGPRSGPSLTTPPPCDPHVPHHDLDDEAEMRHLDVEYRPTATPCTKDLRKNKSL